MSVGGAFASLIIGRIAVLRHIHTEVNTTRPIIRINSRFEDHQNDPPMLLETGLSLENRTLLLRHTSGSSNLDGTYFPVSFMSEHSVYLEDTLGASIATHPSLAPHDLPTHAEDIILHVRPGQY